MTSFVLKVIAAVSMFIDHSKYITPDLNNYITVFLGRISFPLFCFLLVEGYTHTRDFNKYVKRIFIMAIVSQVPFFLFRTLTSTFKLLNICFSLLIGLIAMRGIDKGKNLFVKIIVPTVCVVCSQLLKTDYGAYGIILIISLFVFRENNLYRNISFGVINAVYYLRQLWLTNLIKNAELIIVIGLIGALSSLIFINLYNGKEGRKSKFLYWFYPLSLIFVVSINFLIK